VLVDSGNFTDNPTPKGLARTKGLLEGMARLGYSVVNVGERDVREGYPAFMSTVAGRKLEFVSANLVRQGGDAPVFRPFSIVEAKLSGGRVVRVGVIGALRFNPVFLEAGPDGSQMAIVHPLEPVRRAVAELRKAGADVIVLLAAMHRDDAARLAEEIPELDFVVGSYGGHISEADDRVGEGAWLLYSGNQGKRFGETRVWVDEKSGTARQQTRMHFLNRTYPASESMLAFVNSIPQEEAAAVAATATAGTGTPGPYAGSEACRGCHATEYEEWQGGPHANALLTLEQKNAGARKECLGCHTTAAGLAGGYTDPKSTPGLASVGCESCHGASRAHLAAPEKPYGAIGVSSCTVCHNPANSPKFDYYSYVTRVNHRPAP
jgi:2',3'-cyclic-nucleotide 2'-phosphodiesterase (5'-nucleotidase family)